VPFSREISWSGAGYEDKIEQVNAEVIMSTVYNPEADIMAEIERLELEARDIRKRVEHAHREEDKRVLNRQLKETEDQVEFLRQRLP
jgi:hypothetical protein